MANAKLALEEAFTPKLQSMISAKLAEEADDEEVDETYEGEETEESYHEEEEVSEEEMDEEEMEMDSEEEMEMDSEEEMEMDSEEEMEMDLDSDDSEEEEMEDSEEMEDEEEDDLDLESVIAELEAEMAEEEDMDEEEEVSEEEMDEEEDMDEEEEIDLDEVIRTLKEMEEGDYNEEEEMDEEEVEEDNHAEELEEAYTTIESLRNTINEVNLLNAKLLYTNKLFRTFDLNEGQKVKVLENFDRTSSVREVKLVFSTLAENLNVAKKTKAVVKEGYASKATKSSAPKKIISEGNEMAARWKKLAGLK
jgi:hypothetical protein